MTAAKKKAGLPSCEVTFNVIEFRDAVRGSLAKGSLTSHDVVITRPSANCSLKPGPRGNYTIYVEGLGVVLEFTVNGAGSDYQIVGIAFARANRATGSGAVPLSTGRLPVKGSPFTKIELRDRGLKLRNDIVPPPQGTKPVHKLYKFTLVIQRLRDGAIGLIDPYLENEN